MSENRKIRFTTNKGEFIVEMFEDKAPKTTKNFIELTEKGFYNGVVFHRVIDGFMIQGGDPTGTGMGGPGYKIDDEFGEGLQHDDEGILSMANAGPNTGGKTVTLKTIGLLTLMAMCGLMPPADSTSISSTTKSPCSATRAKRLVRCQSDSTSAGSAPPCTRSGQLKVRSTYWPGATAVPHST